MSLYKYNVAEKFVSINGEGLFAGCPAAFIRFSGCNLKCGYCDTKWAQAGESFSEILTADDIAEYIVSSGIKYVTLTGGEPLWRDGMPELCRCISEKCGVRTEIETNGSIDLNEMISLRNKENFNISLTVDYKLPSSGMEKFMKAENFTLLSPCDSVKFVSASQEDLTCAKEIISRFELDKKCSTIFSPVFGAIEPSDIVDFIIMNKLMSSRVQLQLHKFIWDPDKRGV